MKQKELEKLKVYVKAEINKQTKQQIQILIQKQTNEAPCIKLIILPHKLSTINHNYNNLYISNIHTI